MTDHISGSVRVEGGYAVIRVPLDRLHALRVALEECPCKAAKSTATADIRAQLRAALARLGAA